MPERDKHSSLFCPSVRDEAKKEFNGLPTRSNFLKLFMGAIQKNSKIS
jgi:hypothetical protein